MPIYKTLTKKEIGPIIDPELENELDNETLDTQLNMLKQLNQRNPSRKSLAQFNYLKELSRQRNEAWKDVKSPRIKTKRIHFGKNKTKEFFKDVPTILVPPKLKRTHTVGGKRNTRKTRKHRK